MEQVICILVEESCFASENNDIKMVRNVELLV